MASLLLMSCKMLLSMCIFLLIQILMSDAFVWNLVLTNPHIHETAQTVDPLHPRLSDSSLPVSAASASDPDTFRIEGEHPKSTVPVSNVANGDGVTAVLTTTEAATAIRDPEELACNSNNDCDDDWFCDQHYLICRPVRQEGEMCRHDLHCLPGFDCMFGVCLPSVSSGQKGSRCQSNSDCRAGMCCARQHGERVCKATLKIGQYCYIPDGGLAYSLNELCPCEEGLVCGRTRIQPPGQELEWLRPWNNHRRLRCVRP